MKCESSCDLTHHVIALIADTTVDCVLQGFFSGNFEDSQRRLLWSGFALVPTTLVMIIPGLSSVRLGFPTEPRPVFAARSVDLA